MKKGDLCVFFHAGAQVENRKLQNNLAAETAKAHPRVTSVSTRPELILDTRRHDRPISPFAACITGDDPEDAVRIMKENSKGQPMALVTLCEKMMMAASNAEIPVITVGVPSVTPSRQFIAAGPDRVGEMLRELKRTI